MRPTLRSSLLIATCAVVAGGCLGGRSDPAKLFTLTATIAPDGVPGESWDAALGLGPVAIPGYLDRPQLVTRVGPNELELTDVARWAEPLREGIARALQQDLLVASGARRVALYPWASAAGVDLAVAVDVLGFEAGPRGDAQLVARWTVRDVAGGRVLAFRESRLVEPAQGRGADAGVAALSRALGALAREIAATVREVGR